MGFAYTECYAGGYTELKNTYKNSTFSTRIITKVALLFMVLLVLYKVKQNEFVYYWDHSGYWAAAIARMDYIFNNSLSEAIRSLFQSINENDYNVLLPSVIALPLKIVGDTFTDYVVINFVMFLAPAIMVQGLLAQKLVDGNGVRQDWVIALTVAFAVVFPGNYYAGLRGYIDIAYVLPLSVAMYLFADYNFEKISVQCNVAISLNLLLAWLSRRYVIHFIIGYVVAMAIKFVVTIKKTGKWKEPVINMVQIGGTSLAILLILFRQFFFHALLTNYAGMYSAYDGTLSQKISALLQSFGGVSVIILVVVGILCFLNGKQITNYVCFCAMGISETLIFWRTQIMDVHHRMILNLPIFACMILLMNFWNENTISTAKKYAQKVLVIICALLQLLNFAWAFTRVNRNATESKWFASRYTPLWRSDINQLKKLADKLNTLTEGTDDLIYTVASGGTLNNDIFNKLDMPYSMKAVPNMGYTSDVDLRDGFPTDFLRAKYVVCTTPVQTHLQSGQEVITYLADLMNDPTSYIGSHFENIYQIELEYGVVASVYEKQSEFTQEDLETMRNYYTALYPDSPELFEDRIH